MLTEGKIPNRAQNPTEEWALPGARTMNANKPSFVFFGWWILGQLAFIYATFVAFLRKACVPFCHSCRIQSKELGLTGWCTEFSSDNWNKKLRWTPEARSWFYYRLDMTGDQKASFCVPLRERRVWGRRKEIRNTLRGFIFPFLTFFLIRKDS